MITSNTCTHVLFLGRLLCVAVVTAGVLAASIHHPNGDDGNNDDNSTCGYNDCLNYCAGLCPYRYNMSTNGTVNLTVYRTTPWNVTDLVNHDTGDAAGDIGFMILQYVSQSAAGTHTCLFGFEVASSMSCLRTYSLELFRH